ADRRELLKMLKAVAPGDIVTVTRIDRLARSTFDLFAIVKQIVDAKAQFRSLAEPPRGAGGPLSAAAVLASAVGPCAALGPWRGFWLRLSGCGIRSRSTSASPPRTAIINRPVLVPVSAHGGPRSKNWRRLTMLGGR